MKSNVISIFLPLLSSVRLLPSQLVTLGVPAKTKPGKYSCHLAYFIFYLIY